MGNALYRRLYSKSGGQARCPCSDPPAPLGRHNRIGSSIMDIRPIRTEENYSSIGFENKIVNKHIVISRDPLAEIHDILRRLHTARTNMTDEERGKTEKQYAKRLAKLSQMEEEIRKREADKAAFRKMAEEYNTASREEQARSLGEWMADYFRRNGIEAENEYQQSFRKWQADRSRDAD